MKTFTEQQAYEEAAMAAGNDDLCNTDNNGQIVICTGVFVWQDGSFHDCAEPSREQVTDA